MGVKKISELKGKKGTKGTKMVYKIGKRGRGERDCFKNELDRYFMLPLCKENPPKCSYLDENFYFGAAAVVWPRSPTTLNVRLCQQTLLKCHILS